MPIPDTEENNLVAHHAHPERLLRYVGPGLRLVWFKECASSAVTTAAFLILLCTRAFVSNYVAQLLPELFGTRNFAPQFCRTSASWSEKQISAAADEGACISERGGKQ